MNTDISAIQVLEKIFHEKSRLAIAACLANAEGGIAFTELRKICSMTDGNLKAHLPALEHAGFLDHHKSRETQRERTLYQFNDKGREAFIAYLRSLEDALRVAARSVGATPDATARIMAPA